MKKKILTHKASAFSIFEKSKLNELSTIRGGVDTFSHESQTSCGPTDVDNSKSDSDAPHQQLL